MTGLIEGLLNLIGALLRFAWLPTIVVMLVSFIAMPALRYLPIREELRAPAQRFFRIAAIVSTALVLLAFVFLFGSLWLIGQQNPAPPA